MSQIQLLKTRRFLPLFCTQFLGAFNDNLLKNALVILITFQSASVFGIPPAQMVAAAGGVFILPFLLFSATSGQLADKYDKAAVARWVKIVEIGIMILATIGFMTHHYEFLVAVLFMMGLHSTFFGPVKYSMLPQHLTSEELVGGNALIEAGTFLSILIGTIAGGVLISIENGPTWVSAGLLTVAVLGYLTSRSIPEARSTDPSLKVSWNPITPTIEIIRFTTKTRAVFLSILGSSWFWFFGAAILSLFPSYCKDVLGTNESVVTLFLATFSVGIGLGSLLCERFSRRHLELGLVPLGSIGMTAFAIDLYFIGQPTFASAAPIGILALLSEAQGLHIVFDLLMISVFSGFFIVPLYTMMQERSEISHRSRVIAANNIINALFMVVSAGLVMLLLKMELTIPQIFLVLALLNAAVALYIYTLLPEFLLRFIIWMIANVMYRMKIRGLDNIPKTGPAVLVSNHVSFVDWMIIGAAIQRPVRFVMDHAFAKGKITRQLLKQGKVILIASAKENPALLQQAFERTGVELRDGQLVCIFPEGRLTADGNLSVFKPGVEKIIADTPVPVIPMALRGMWGSFFSREGGKAIMKRPKRFWSRVELVIDKPVPPSEAKAESLQRIVQDLLSEER